MSDSTSTRGLYLASVVDDEERVLDIVGRRGTLAPPTVDALVGMYAGFGFADRAQGVPPMGSDATRQWLDDLGERDAHQVVTRDGDAPVAHAVLVPDRDRGTELAILVHPDYRNAHVGTHTMTALLDYGAARGVGSVWLHVEKSNRPAIALYRRYEFEIVESTPLDFEMHRSLADRVRARR